jgi:hypothetical protein
MGGRAAPVWRVYEPKKTGARSARARTRGKNPLVENIKNNSAFRNYDRQDDRNMTGWQTEDPR